MRHHPLRIRHATGIIRATAGRRPQPGGSKSSGLHPTVPQNHPMPPAAAQARAPALHQGVGLKRL